MTVTRESLLKKLATAICDIRVSHAVRVAIDGVDAAGKTTLANELAETIATKGRHAIRASIDGFHNPASVRRQRGSLSPEGYFRDSFNLNALIENLLDPLGPEGNGMYRDAVFDFRIDAPVMRERKHAPTDAILLFDGVFLLRPELAPFWDFSVFVHSSFQETLRRAESRDETIFGSVETVRERYNHRYIPGQRMYLDTVQPAEKASIVIDNENPACPTLIRSA